MTHQISAILSARSPSILMQIEIDRMGEMFPTLGADLGASLLNLLKAILILLVGWVIALILKSLILGLLKRTDIDNKIASWLTGRPGDGDPPAVEQWIGQIVYWLVILFAVIAALEALELRQVSEPLQALLNQVTGFIPQLAAAAALLGIAWVVATLVKALVVRALRTVRLDERLGQQVGDGDARTSARTPSMTSTTRSQFSLSETIGNALYWFIFLIFLPSILSTLELEGTLEPVQDLLNQVLAILPNILAAVLVGAVGWLVAQVVRRVVTNLLAATGVDQIGAKFGMGGTTQSQSLSWILGTIVYVLILIPVSIAALNRLKIDAISEPAIAMLGNVAGYLPLAFGAAVIIALGYVAGQYLSELVANILAGVGFDNITEWLGLGSVSTTFDSRPGTTTTRPSTSFGTAPGTTTTQPSTPFGTESGTSTGYTAPPPPSPLGEESATDSLPLEKEVEPEVQAREARKAAPRTPSEIVGVIVWVAVMLFATLAAVDVLQIAALTLLVAGIIAIAGQVLAGLIVFAIGLYFANLAFGLIAGSGDRQARLLAQTARIAVIVLAAAMALQQMGIAPNIINLAFGLLLGAIAVAIALAFGLGSRDIAASQVREWLDSFKRQ